MVTKLLPVNQKGNYFVTIGGRLKEERERLGFNQSAFAALADTTKKSQIDYEKDSTQPKAGYFVEVSKVGADVQYIITGCRSTTGLADDEQELLSLFRVAPLSVRVAVLGALMAGNGDRQDSGIKVSGVGNRVAGRDYREKE